MLSGDEQPLTSRDVLYRGLFEHPLVEVHMWRVVRTEAGAIRTWALVDANPAALASWGTERSDVVGLTAEQIFPGSDAVEVFLPIVEQVMRTGESREWEVDFAGTDQILHMVTFPVGEYFVSAGFDVTARRRQARELRDALDRLNQAIRAGGVGLWDWDLVTDEVHYSDEWKRQLGYEPHEIDHVYTEWESRLHPDDKAAALADVRARIASGTLQDEIVFRMRHRDGSYRWILATSSVISDAEGTPRRMLGSHVDITERRRLEERVQEAQKLDALGTLAAGIAHDFNNLLTAITGNLSLLRLVDMSSAERSELLGDVEDAAHRAQALTGQLLTFAKGGSPVREVASLADMIVQSATFVTRGSHVRCAFSIPEDLAAVDADVVQISQVIDNLVLNARQAMSDAGIIRVRASNLTLEHGNELGLEPGSWVHVSVRDEGSGISPEDARRIFDPFFTTKQRGSGLGLSSAYAIVSRHGGRITVESELGRGSTFHLYLPATCEVAPAARPADEVVRGAGRILVVDDEPVIRSTTRRTLVAVGYSCDVAADGARALDAFTRARAAGEPFDLVVLDLTLAGGPGGREVLRSLRAVDPDVLAVVASGYTEDGGLTNYQDQGFQGRVRKPFDTATLTREVARVLGSRRAEST